MILLTYLQPHSTIVKEFACWDIIDLRETTLDRNPTASIVYFLCVKQIDEINSLEKH